MKKIYSGFTFYNEFDLLEIRLGEMYDYVDYFIIVEADCTFTARPKPFNLESQWDRYSAWHDKIRYIKVTDMPNNGNAWHNEAHQRNQILRGCTDADDNDIIIIGDVDEIIRQEALEHVRNTDQEMYPFRMPMFNFRYNYMVTKGDHHMVWPIGVRKSVLNQCSPEDVRRSRYVLHENYQCVDHSGWHFTWLGNNDFVLDKLSSFSHVESDIPEVRDQIDVASSISEGLGVNRTDKNVHFEPVKMDWYMPKSITGNLDKYADLILPNPEHSALDFLPDYLYNQ